MKNFFNLLFQLAFIGTSLSQSIILEFPQNVDINNYKRCTHDFDTTEIKKSIAEIDFEMGQLDYDYSRVELVDINKDGKCEIFHYFSSGVRGWPHDFLTVYIDQNKKLTKIFDGSSYFVTFAESNDKYLQINYIGFDGHKTNPTYKNAVWRFDGHEYKPHYSPNLTKGEFKSKGLEFYKANNYMEALICFKNVMVFPHISDNELLASANDVAITLIKLKQLNKVEPYLLRYISKAKNKKLLASSYYNIGLAKEMGNSLDEAVEHFKRSNKYNPTNAAMAKIKKYER